MIAGAISAQVPSLMGAPLILIDPRLFVHVQKWNGLMSIDETSHHTS